MRVDGTCLDSYGVVLMMDEEEYSPTLEEVTVLDLPDKLHLDTTHNLVILEQ